VGKQGASISHATKIELLGAWCPCLHSDAVQSSWLFSWCVCVWDRDEGLLQCCLYSIDVCLLPYLFDCCSLHFSEVPSYVIASLKSLKYHI